MRLLPPLPEKEKGNRKKATGKTAPFGLLPLAFIVPFSFFLYPSVVGAAPAAADPQRRTALVEVVDHVRAAVVNIHSERTLHAPDENVLLGAPASSRVNGMGTGIVIDPRGYIVTNHHVVEDVQLLRVRLNDGGNFPARVVARNAEQDLALLKIDAPRPLAVMPLGTATDLMVGEPVVAIGNAYGYEHSVTVGVVSAVKRDVTLNKEVAYKALIQTDASINPGNSGGPLLNAKGELVGVNVAIRAGAQGIGFAIPVDTMLRVAADMLGERRRLIAAHGLTLRDQVDASGPAVVRSLLVEQVDPASQTARAGVQAGDVLRTVGGREVVCNLDLERALLDRAVGDRLPVTVRRGGEEKAAELVLQGSEAAAAPADLIWRKLGVRLGPVTSDMVTRINPSLHGGLAVLDVNPQSNAGRVFQRGDILVGLHQWETLTLENVSFVLTHPDLPSFVPLRFFVIRNGQLRRSHLPALD
jgi:serine protease Do